MNEQLWRALEKGNFEETESGIVFPESGAKAAGRFVLNKRGEPEEYSDNEVVGEALTYLLGAALYGSTPTSNWYIAIFSGDVTVQSTWNASNFASNATEITAYTSGTRPAWTPTAPAAGVISSFSAKTSFTANASITVRGAGVLSDSSKGSISGTLLAASRFATDKSLADTEILDVGYQLQLTAS